MEFNIADLFELVADTVPERVAVVAGPTRLTYAELDARANSLARSLADRGVGTGDHVGCYLHNDAEHLEAMLAAYKLRAVPINVNYRYVDEELEYLFTDAGLAGLVYGAEFRAHVAAVAPRVASLRVVVEAAPPGAPGAPAGVARAAGTLELAELRRITSPARLDVVRSGDDRYVLYTGGTTGRPKGVVWRHEDIIFAALGGGNAGGPPLVRPEAIAAAVVANRAQRVGPFLAPGDPGPDHFVNLALGPLMHAGGQWSALGTLLGGGTCVLDPDRHLDFARVLDLVARERVVALTVVGDAHARPLADLLAAQTGSWDLSSLLLLGSGGSMLSADVKRRLLDGVPSLLGILEGLGSSESPVQGIAITRRGDATPEALTFASRDTTVVLDDALRPVRPGSGVVGRVATTGRIPIGYHDDPEKTAATFVAVGGVRYALPGDMATVDADGTLRLLGRGSLCINTGGEKVYPEEVEAALKSHPGVADAVVVGVPDPTWGQRVAAVVQPVDPGAPPTPADLDRHCRAHVAGYKVPRVLAFVDAVRRSAAGKPDYPWARAVVAAAQGPAGSG
ncbi:MAG: AMP-binding protein [Actinomycetota bacterium]